MTNLWVLGFVIKCAWIFKLCVTWHLQGGRERFNVLKSDVFHGIWLSEQYYKKYYCNFCWVSHACVANSCPVTDVFDRCVLCVGQRKRSQRKLKKERGIAWIQVQDEKTSNVTRTQQNLHLRLQASIIAQWGNEQTQKLMKQEQGRSQGDPGVPVTPPPPL